jgi:hypothetical protein
VIDHQVQLVVFKFLGQLRFANGQPILPTIPAAGPRVIACEWKIMAQSVIFYLGRMTIVDFGEISTLADNGRGFGAQDYARHV